MQFTNYEKGASIIVDNRQAGQQIDYSATLRVGHLQFVALGKFYWEIMVGLIISNYLLSEDFSSSCRRPISFKKKKKQKFIHILPSTGNFL